MSVFEMDTSRINIGRGLLQSACSMTFMLILIIFPNAAMLKTQAEICSVVMELDLDKSVLLSGLTSRENAEENCIALSSSSFACMGTEGELV
jgi:hypothetical protein